MSLPLKDRKLAAMDSNLTSEDVALLKNTSPLQKNLGPGCQPLAEETFKFLSSNKIMKRYEQGLKTDNIMANDLDSLRSQREK